MKITCLCVFICMWIASVTKNVLSKRTRGFKDSSSSLRCSVQIQETLEEFCRPQGVTYRYVINNSLTTQEVFCTTWEAVEVSHVPRKYLW